MAKKDEPKHPLVTVHCTDNLQLNELLSDLLITKRAFAVTYDDTSVIITYSGPSKE